MKKRRPRIGRRIVEGIGEIVRMVYPILQDGPNDTLPEEEWEKAADALGYLEELRAWWSDKKGGAT